MTQEYLYWMSTLYFALPQYAEEDWHMGNVKVTQQTGNAHVCVPVDSKPLPPTSQQDDDGLMLYCSRVSPQLDFQPPFGFGFCALTSSQMTSSKHND